MDEIIIVSGLPRTGTSMMMKMLEKGGIEVVTDGVREANVDNPKGYYEYEKVKKIKEDSGWLSGIKGKAVKMVSKLLLDLPEDYQYKIIFMERNIKEVLISQRKMLKRLNKPKPEVDDATMGQYYKKHLIEVKNWLESEKNIDYLSVSYNEVVEYPLRKSQKINDFLNGRLNIEKMASVIDKNLYRNKVK